MTAAERRELLAVLDRIHTTRDAQELDGDRHLQDANLCLEDVETRIQTMLSLADIPERN